MEKQECQSCCFLSDIEALNWTDIKTTGLIYATINLLFFSVMLSWVSIISVVTNFLLVSLLTAIVVCYFMEKPPKDDNEYEYFSKDSLEAIFKKFYLWVISLEEKIKKITSLESPVCTIKTIVGLYILSVISSHVCSCFLVFLATNIFFIVPLVRKYKQKEITKIYDKVSEITKDLLKKVESKIPRYEEKAKKN